MLLQLINLHLEAIYGNYICAGLINRFFRFLYDIRGFTSTFCYKMLKKYKVMNNCVIARALILKITLIVYKNGIHNIYQKLKSYKIEFKYHYY